MLFNPSEALAAANTLATSPAEAKRIEATIDVWRNFQKQLPPTAHTALLDDDQVMRDLVQIYARSPGDLDRALAGIPAALLVRRAKAAVDGVGAVATPRYREDKGGSIEYSIPAESWRVLWQRIPAPIDYSGRPALAEGVQPVLWQELYASGYANRDSESALGSMLSSISAGDLQALWPRLESYFPDIRQSAPQMALADYRMVSRNVYC